MSDKINKKIFEIYLLGKNYYESDPNWEKLTKYETLELDDLNKVFNLVIDLLNAIGITNDEINSKGILIEDGIDLINHRRFILQKQKP